MKGKMAEGGGEICKETVYWKSKMAEGVRGRGIWLTEGSGSEPKKEKGERTEV